MPRARQQVHQRSVHSGPLVLGTNLLKYQRLQQIGDQPVSRMFPFITERIGLYHYLFKFAFAKVDEDSLRVVSTGAEIFLAGIRFENLSAVALASCHLASLGIALVLLRRVLPILVNVSSHISMRDRRD